MTHQNDDARPAGRREFLLGLSGAGLAAASGLALGQAAGAEDAPAIAKPIGPAMDLLPTIQLGQHRVTRLFAGWNPIGGYSHSSETLSRLMREYFTVERIAEFLLRCEHQGINAWQYAHAAASVKALRNERALCPHL